MNPGGKTVISRIQKLQLPDWIYPVFLLFLCIFAYGILIPWLGIYSDDWFLTWTYFKLGNAGIQTFYNTNRPLLATVLKVIIPLFKFTPWPYQIFALLSRWGTGCIMWLLIRRLWPERNEFATWASALFLLYPAFTLQNMAITYGNDFVYLCAFLLSLYWTIRAVQEPKRNSVFTILALLLSAVNLLVLEYFFLLELVRPILIWLALGEVSYSFKQKLWKTIKLWLPYVALFLLVDVYRVFFSSQLTTNRELVLLDQFRAGFGPGIVYLFKSLIQYAYVNIVQSWAAIFRTSIETNIGTSSFIVFWILVVSALMFSFVWLYFERREFSNKPKPNKSLLFSCLWITGVTLILAGVPFLTIGSTSELLGFFSRVNLSYMFGICILVTGLIELIPLKRIWKISLVSILIGFSVGWQFRVSTGFRLDWKDQERFYWELTWRMPNLEPGTLIVVNDIPELGYEGYTALTSAVDYIYTRNAPTDQLKYELIYGSEYPELLKTSNPVVHQLPDFIFPVDNSKIVAVIYLHDCPQVIDPQFMFETPGVPHEMSSFVPKSSTKSILNSHPIHMDTALFGEEPDHNWCYFFSKADLARQQGNWDEVVNLESQALAQFGIPDSNPRQVFPLIEGLALRGEWLKVQDLFLQSFQIEYERLKSSSEASYGVKQAYLTFWKYLDTHSTQNELKAAAQTSILTVIQAP
jgi:hypothetical protein